MEPKERRSEDAEKFEDVRNPAHGMEDDRAVIDEDDLAISDVVDDQGRRSGSEGE